MKKWNWTSFFAGIGILACMFGFVVAFMATGIALQEWADKPKLALHPLQDSFQDLETIQYFSGYPSQFKDGDEVSPLVVAKVKGDNEWRLWLGTKSYPQPSSTIFLASPREGWCINEQCSERLVYVTQSENQEGRETMRVVIDGKQGPEFGYIFEPTFAVATGRKECRHEDGELRCEVVRALGDPLYFGCPIGRNCSRGWSVIWGTQVLADKMDKQIMSDSLRFVSAAGKYIPVFSYYDERGGKSGVVTVMDGQESFLPFKDQTMPPSSPETTEL